MKNPLHFLSLTQCLPLGLALVLITSTGCRSVPENQFDPYADSQANSADLKAVSLESTLDPSMLKPPSAPFSLGPGDMVNIEILGQTNAPVPTLVGPDGKLYFHLLPGLQVTGKSLAEVSESIALGLSDFLRNPKVSVSLQQVKSKRIWMLGRLGSPGIYPLENPTTVVESIVRAGGLDSSRFSGTTEELADLRHGFLIRDGEFLPVDFHGLLREGDMSQNIYLHSNDYIYLPSSLSQEVYVMGAVTEPRAVGFKDAITLVSAIAIAQGTIENAYLSHVAIVRGSLVNPSVAIVNYKDIIQGRVPDVLLQPRDIVYVPLSPYRKINEYASLIVNTFVRTVAANEGSRAADSDADPASVNIGLSD